ncbi:hypothetical protein ACFY8O_16105 [Streptomyces argenteolus]|uniref:Secreted protein n=1 Tax=Streptomyces argenteolus TaxID=67274 RepID=A0ABW6X5Z0_9ACTN
MTRVSVGTDRRRGTDSLPVALAWALMLVAVFLCCSHTAAPSPRDGAPSTATDVALTPGPSAAVSVVTADAPAERGVGSSCHGATDHSSAVVLPGPTAPVALPCGAATPRTAPLSGAAVIRGPSNDGVHAVDHLRLQVQRI